MSTKNNYPKTTDELFRVLPKQTGTNIQFGLMVIPELNGKKWCARYFSISSRISDDRIPMTRGKSPNSVLKKMYEHFKKNMPEELNKNWY